jgi:outer membrane immunogenic protein
VRKAVLTAAAVCAVAGGAMTNTATAADYMAPPPAYQPAYQPAWQGFYIGGHGGGGEAKVRASASVDYVDEFDAGLDRSGSFRKTLAPEGLIAGGQVGYNWQFNSLVVGLEGDLSFTDWGSNSTLFNEPLDDFGIAADAIGTARTDIDMLASIRGRLGMAFDTVLVYGTGGVAWVDGDVRGRLVVDDGFDSVEVWSKKKGFNSMGFVAGGGLSWMVIPQTFSVGLEGLYYWFDEEETLFDDTYDLASGELTVNAKASVDNAWVVRVRGDFHF